MVAVRDLLPRFIQGKRKTRRRCSALLQNGVQKRYQRDKTCTAASILYSQPRATIPDGCLPLGKYQECGSRGAGG